MKKILLPLHYQNKDMKNGRKTYTFEESLNRALGQKGEPLRDEYENEMKSFLIGESIRKARQAKELTQEQLGELMGVKRAQVWAQWKFSGDKHKSLQVDTERTFHQRYPLAML